MLMIAINFEYGITLSRILSEDIASSLDNVINYANNEIGEDADEVFLIENDEVAKYYTIKHGWF